jgi:hypothetical protein
MRPESGARGEFRALGGDSTPHANIWCHFQGTSRNQLTQGLKPWAMVCNRFGRAPGLRPLGVQFRLSPFER